MANSFRLWPHGLLVCVVLSYVPSVSTEIFTPQDCGDLLAEGFQTSRDYIVGYPQPFHVYCDMDTDAGGWTVIQRRQDGSVPFDKTWTEYEQEFGNPTEEFWAGLGTIHDLTTQKQNELYVYLEDWEGHSRHARYSVFSVGGASGNYQATLSGYTGDAGDDLTLADENGRHSIDGREFSTKDQDNDDSSSHCASTYGQGGWWYPASCGYAMLNGQYLTACSDTSTCDSAQGITSTNAAAIATTVPPKRHVPTLQGPSAVPVIQATLGMELRVQM
ncbi:PREDICTED: fibrinogen C domain-containing protein 1-A-like [Branchiostoma belcheri]|uniref:Fibrinogen C domain-containing protein 1-A-like n=1 Tax=Branchiostoma belcheri TaxID=7741 RepID=A0A6P4ZIG7_BRABE|nr:PREDICTED: fibrinogen C domain-containing protein 1-A-like [Branchiostoma belcheri]